MKKYYIALSVLAGIITALLIYTIVLGRSGMADQKTYDRASDIATKLNTYIDSKAKIPAALDEAGIKDVPSSVTYSKKSDELYEFCVTYKQTNSGDNSTPLLGSATSILAGQLYGQSSDDYYSSNYLPSSLYLTYQYKAGKNCQTIKPYLSSYNSPYESTYKTSPTLMQQDPQGTNKICASTYSYGGYYTDYFFDIDTKTKTIGYTILKSSIKSSGGYTYSNQTVFYDKDCKKIDVAALVKGDSFKAYYDGSTIVSVLQKTN